MMRHEKYVHCCSVDLWIGLVVGREGRRPDAKVVIENERTVEPSLERQPEPEMLYQ